MEKALALAAALAVPVIGPAVAQPVPLAVFPDAPQELRSWMAANDWASKRQEPKDWALEPGVLHMKGSADSVLIGTEKGFPRSGRRLRFTLKVAATPKGTDLSKKSGDDAAFRAYIAFGRGGGIFSPPNTIAYAWCEKGAAGALVRSAHFSNLAYVCLGSGATDWTTVEADLAADYARAFPKDSGGLPALKGLLLKSDSNDTKSTSEAWLRSVELLP
ncbi:MAG: DUF3047 domain-containing protein [Elusimicrobia bacterium]|nr:DUF3047 domain-containing protein [Elusimicrobiota bacterium]